MSITRKLSFRHDKSSYLKDNENEVLLTHIQKSNGTVKIFLNEF